MRFLVTKASNLYISHWLHSIYVKPQLITWPRSFIIELYCFSSYIQFSTPDDSDFLTIVTCCLCALIIVSALLVYGSFKVSGLVVSCDSLNNKFTCFIHSSIEHQKLRCVVDICRSAHCRHSAHGAFRCHSRCQYEKQWGVW